MKNKKFRIKKRLQALLLAVAITVTTLGSVTTVTAKTGFSFPFDFLLFQFGEAEETMTEKELEEERDRLREQSAKAEKAAGLKLVYQYEMDSPQPLNTLSLSGCQGKGSFAFAKPEFVPEKGVTVCEIVFTPDSVKAYEYDKMLGWDKDTKTLRRYAEVICTALAKSEEEVTNETEEAVPTPTPVATPEITPTLTPVATPVVTPEAEEKEEVTPTPTATPEITPEAEGKEEVIPTPTATPEITPEAEEKEEVIPTPTATPEITPEAEEKEEVTPTPTATPEPTPEAEGKEDAAATPAPTATPEAEKKEDAAATPAPTATPEPIPEPVVTAPANPGSPLEQGVAVIEKNAAVLALEKQIQELKNGNMQALLDVSKEYDSLTDEEKSTVSSDLTKKLISLQDAAAAVNHTSNGVTVSGNVPWYVELIVVIGNDTDTYVPTGLDTIVPYDMCLWNLMTDSEYILCGGEKVTLTMAVPENIHLYDGLTIVHYMDETHYEYIELNITGDRMSFETASFSPFNVAGSTVLVGGKTENDKTDSGKTEKPADTAKPSNKPSDTADKTKPSNSNKDQNKGNNKGNNKTESTKPSSNNKNNADKPVKTGDAADAASFFMIGMSSAVLMALCVLLMRASKEEEIF